MKTALDGLCKTHNEKMRTENQEDKKRELERLKEAAEPLIKYLCENYHPHITAIVTPTSVEVMQGIRMVSGIDENIVD